MSRRRFPKTNTTRTKKSNSSSIVTYTYDDAGHMLSTDGPLSDSGDAVYYRYDAAGRQTWEIRAERKTWDNGANNYTLRRVAKNLTLRQQDSQPSTIKTGWISTPIDINPSLNIDSTETITYTDHGLAKQIKTTAGGISLLKQIDYDLRNRVLCETRRMKPETFSNPPTSACSLGVAGSFGPDRIKRYDYDSESRVTKVTSEVAPFVWTAKPNSISGFQPIG